MCKPTKKEFLILWYRPEREHPVVITFCSAAEICGRLWAVLSLDLKI